MSQSTADAEREAVLRAIDVANANDASKPALSVAQRSEYAELLEESK